MERSNCFRAAAVLISISAVVYLAAAIGRLWAFLGDLIMVVFFAWLVGSLLIHFVNSLMYVPHMRRPLAILLVYVWLIMLASSFAFLVIPATAVQARDFAETIPEWTNESLPVIIERVESIAVNLGVDELLGIEDLDLQGQLETLAASFSVYVIDFLQENALSIGQTAISTIVNVGLVLVLSFYIVIDGGRRLNQALTVLPPRWEAEVRLVLSTFDATFHGYVRGMLLVSLIYGVGTAGVMFAVGLPLALPIAIISSLLLAVPFVGDWLALALPLLTAALVGDFFTFIVVLAVLLFIQQVMLNLLTPRILGRAVRMPAMLVIISVVLGARIAGIAGALLGVPAAAVLYSLAVTYGTRIRARRWAQERQDQDEEIARRLHEPDAPGAATPDQPPPAGSPSQGGQTHRSAQQPTSGDGA